MWILGKFKNLLVIIYMNTSKVFFPPVGSLGLTLIFSPCRIVIEGSLSCLYFCSIASWYLPLSTWLKIACMWRCILTYFYCINSWNFFFFLLWLLWFMTTVSDPYSCIVNVCVYTWFNSSVYFSGMLLQSVTQEGKMC